MQIGEHDETAALLQSPAGDAVFNGYKTVDIPYNNNKEKKNT
ncbi:hypothetical protein HMPREF1548_04692 [Clostridium sp. KLE 1755]|nr:hypothetical protein HMPREF1548_04692 [Clostridium sp. KLE 1755]